MNLFFTNMIQENWTFLFWIWFKRIEPFFFVLNMIQRMELLWVLLKVFHMWFKVFFFSKKTNDSKNWTFFFWKYDTENWTFCKYDSKNWTFFFFFFFKYDSKNWPFKKTWLKELNLQEKKAHRIEPFFLNMTQRIEPFFLNMTQRIELFF